jgi:hypothetical protein
MRMARPLFATTVAALALSLPSAGLANKGGVPNNHSTTAPNGKSITHRPSSNTCPDRDKGKAKRKGASHGKKRGRTKGRKCGFQ